MPARPASTLLLVLLLAASALAPGCDEEDGTGLVLPPIEFRTTTPRDAVRINTAGEDTVVLDLSVTFTRSTRPGEITFEMFPPLPRSGTIVRSVTGRNWSWRDVVMAESDSVYFWLIDGIEVLQPKVIRLVVSPIVSSVGFRGTLSSSSPAQAPAQGTVLFALEPGGGFNPLDPITFFDTSPLAAATPDSLGPLRERDFRFSHMRQGKAYLVVGIQDTSGDARYDPVSDWWGYRVDPQGGPELVRATLEFGAGYRTDVDIVLRPPGAPPIEP